MCIRHLIKIAVAIKFGVLLCWFSIQLEDKEDFKYFGSIPKLFNDNDNANDAPNYVKKK